ncbi:MAG: uracil-DNA glycosylase [Pseudomonadota bacterium]|nr:uracil-DNA glycosylase [Pseudomonadota bacterium]
MEKRSMKFHDDDCRSCPRLANYLQRTRSQFPGHRCLPVPSFGDTKAAVLIVGLAPGMHGANATGRPFTGDHAGKLLYSTLFEYGFSNNAKSVNDGDGLRLYNCRIANAVKCLPPENKPTISEIVNCNNYLRMEISVLKHDSILIALGKIAHDAILRALRLPMSKYKFEHGAEHLLEHLGLLILDSYHCSRYNTQTKRLTVKMFGEIFQRAREVIEKETS